MHLPQKYNFVAQNLMYVHSQVRIQKSNHKLRTGDEAKG